MGHQRAVLWYLGGVIINYLRLQTKTLHCRLLNVRVECDRNDQWEGAERLW